MMAQDTHLTIDQLTDEHLKQLYAAIESLDIPVHYSLLRYPKAEDIRRVLQEDRQYPELRLSGRNKLVYSQRGGLVFIQFAPNSLSGEEFDQVMKRYQKEFEKIFP